MEREKDPLTIDLSLIGDNGHRVTLGEASLASSSRSGNDSLSLFRDFRDRSKVHFGQIPFSLPDKQSSIDIAIDRNRKRGTMETREKEERTPSIPLTISGSNKNDKNDKNDKFEHLMCCLEKLMKEQPISPEDVSLDETDQKVFFSVFLRKLKRKESSGIPEKDELEDRILKGAIVDRNQTDLDLLNRLAKAENKPRRVEEKRKFVFKMTINKLRERFFTHSNLSREESCLKRKDEESELRFWEFYFKDYCIENGIPLDSVYDPLNNVYAVNRTFATINKKYLRTVFGNEDFRKAFFLYLDRFLKEDYEPKIRQKFKLLLSDFRKGERVEDFIRKRINVVRCKLPWFLSEVDDAIRDFKKVVSNVTKSIASSMNK